MDEPHRPPPAAALRTVGDELRLVFRCLIAIVLLLLAVNIGTRSWLLAHVNPQVHDLRSLQNDLEHTHAGLLDEETALRAYLATGESDFLAPYRAAVPVVARDSRMMAATVTGSQLTQDLLAMQLAQRDWTSQWVQVAVDPARAARTGAAAAQRRHPARLSAFLRQGKTLLDRYRVAHDRLATHIGDRLDAAADSERNWLLWSGVVQGLIAFAIVGLSVGFRRRARQRLTEPVSDLAAAVRAIRAGDLDTRVRLDGAPAEILGLADDVNTMAATLADKGRLAEERASEAAQHLDRLSLVLGVAREVAGSLNMRYVLDSVTAAALTVTGADCVRVWLVDDDERRVTLSFDTDTGKDGPGSIQQVDVGAGVVGRAVKYGRPVGPEPLDDGSDGDLAGRHAVVVPMIVGARVVGALECIEPPGVSACLDAVAVLETLAGHAAGAVESARLHERTQELSVTDALTGLANRRAFDEEFANESARALRYRRPLSVISVDLDRFKALNDRYGHGYGDIALQQAAAAIRSQLRDSDRAYRLGGEEIAVLAPETDAASAAELAERLRAAIEGSAGPGAPQVTGSLGVAELPSHASDPATLLVAADRALYDAKAAGRNRVVVAAAVAPAVR